MMFLYCLHEQSRSAAAAQSNKLRSATSLESCDVEDCCVSSWRGQQESTPEENQARHKGRGNTRDLLQLGACLDSGGVM